MEGGSLRRRKRRAEEKQLGDLSAPFPPYLCVSFYETALCLYFCSRPCYGPSPKAGGPGCLLLASFHISS